MFRISFIRLILYMLLEEILSEIIEMFSQIEREKYVKQKGMNRIFQALQK